MKIKNIFSQLKKNWGRWYWWENRINQRIISMFYRNNGEYVLDRDWDNLIIIDACRHDVFQEVISDCDYIISRGSTSSEFVEENFCGKSLKDTVVVTANGFYNMLCKKSFYKVISLWDFCWNDKWNTVFPEKVHKYALEASSKYPDKKLVIHFMQPHAPYLKNPELHYWENGKVMMRATNPEMKYVTPIERAKVGDLNWNEVLEGYKNNLKYVYPFALDLAIRLEGKSVITADHGEGFNDRVSPFTKATQHFPGLYHECLVKVPWLELSNDD